ncbi:RNA-directed DNA polymerase, eukaryota [Tanacetum coccineum]
MFYQNRPFHPSYNNQNAFYQSLTGLYRPTMESSSSQANQPYSLVDRINLDMDFEQLMFSQEYYPSQDYSMGHGLAYGPAHVNDDEEDDSPVEELLKEWTVEKEITLCQAWCDVSENNIVGNIIKTKGFWDAVIRYFEKETGSSRDDHESGSNNLDVFQKACAEYKMIYKQDFTLEHCYNILKDHQGWLEIEMPAFYNNAKGQKKSKTSETTSGSVSSGFNLNNEADEAEEETQEVRPPGRDQSKAKKKSAASSHGKSSSFVDLVADKFLNIKKDKWSKREEQKQSYIQLKNQELDIQEAERREAAELKREKIAIQRRTLKLAKREKHDRDILFYNTEINSSLPAIQQQKLQEMKDEIKERYNLDY